MLTRRDPFAEPLSLFDEPLMSLRRAMDQLFEQSFINPAFLPAGATAVAPMDVCETPDGYEVDIALPGVRPEDIELTVDQNALTIRGRYSHQIEHQGQQQSQVQQQAQPGQQGQPRHKDGHNWLRREIPSGTFERRITFARPIDTNKVQTSLQNGILTIQLPVTQESQPKRISIGTGKGQQQIPVGTR